MIGAACRVSAAASSIAIVIPCPAVGLVTWMASPISAAPARDVLAGVPAGERVEVRVPRQRRTGREHRTAGADRGDLVLERARAEKVHLRTVHQRRHPDHARPLRNDHDAPVPVKVEAHRVL